MSKHDNVNGADVHTPYRQVFANAAARTGDATLYVAADVNKKALQVDTNQEFRLASIGPTVWQLVGDGAAGGTLQGAVDGGAGVTLNLSGANDMVWDSSPPNPLGLGLFQVTRGGGGTKGAILIAPGQPDDIADDGGFSVALAGAGSNQTTAGTGQPGTAGGESIYGGQESPGGVGSAASGGGVPGASGGAGGEASIGGGNGGDGGAGDTADAGGDGGAANGFSMGGATGGGGGAAGSGSAAGSGGSASGSALEADDGGRGGAGSAGGQAGSGGQGGELVIAGGKGGNAGVDNGGGGFDGGLGGVKSIVAGGGGDGTGAGGDGGDGGLMEVFGGDAGAAAGGTPGTAGKLVVDAGFAGSGTEAAVDIGAAAASAVNLGRALRPVPFVGIPTLPTFTVATLPSVSTFVRGMIWVSDETGGAQPAFSNGTNWLRFSDGAIVS